MEVMKEHAPAGHPRPARPAAHPHPAGARGRAPRARLPGDPGHGQPGRGGAGPGQAGRATASQATPCQPRLAEREQTGEERLAKLLHDLPVEVKPAGLLLVVRTVPGSAHAIAASLDRCRWAEVVGSIAGDDTLFLAFADRAALQRVRKRLARLARP